jgi:hypothetical protein
MGWIAIQLKWIQDRHEALDWVMNINARGNIRSLVTGRSRWMPAPWSIRIFGERAEEWIRFDASRLDDGDDASARLRHLQRLFPESDVRPWDPSDIPDWRPLDPSGWPKPPRDTPDRDT